MAYNSIFYLLYLAANHIFRRIFEHKLTDEQIFLEKVTGEKYPQEKAEYLWRRISNHKWYVGEKLKRDVGFNVSAIDFLENFAERESVFENPNDFNDSKLNTYAGMSSFA